MKTTKKTNTLIATLFCWGLGCAGDLAAASTPREAQSAAVRNESLPVIEKVEIKVQASSVIGAIRRVNGINNSAPLAYNKHPESNLVSAFKGLKIPMTRFHDAALFDFAYQLVDVSRIFPIWNADIDNPDNYCFAETDDYIAQCLATGSQIEYRLGESIEPSSRYYRTAPPKDYGRWADICVHIIRHYNAGWANGFHHNIRYWSIWEEPNNPNLWHGDFNEYFRLYAVAAKKIKAAFPDLKVGGPQTTWGGEKLIQCRAKFIEYCRENSVPIDFCSWTVYVREPEEMVEQINYTRHHLDRFGYKDAEVNIAEWHYGPISWDVCGVAGEKAEQERAEMRGINSAAFTAYSLSLFQDTPLTMSYFYTAFEDSFGLFNRDYLPNKDYYAFKAFAAIADCTQRIAASPRPHRSVRVLAGKRADGNVVLLVSCFKSGAMDLAIDSGDAVWREHEVLVLDEDHDLTAGSEALVKDGNTLTIKKDQPGSAVYLVNIKK